MRPVKREVNLHTIFIIRLISLITAASILLSAGADRAFGRADEAEKSYQKARRLYLKVERSPQLSEKQGVWEKVIDRYDEVASYHPESHRAPYALYMAARCSARLYKQTDETDYLLRSISYFSRLAMEHHGHHLADDALYYIGFYYQKIGETNKAARAYKRVLDYYPDGDFYARSQERYRQLPKDTAELNEDYKEALDLAPILPLSRDFKKKLKTAAERFDGNPTIVIDPGHGGKDPGAIGPNGLMEKDVVLEIGLILAKKLEKLPDVEVVMTRTRDTFLTLEQRTEIANKHSAELFLSIHLNAIANPKFCGVETYFLNLTNDPRSLAVAAKENATTEKKLSDLQLILMDLLNDSKIKESSGLAEIVHGELFKFMRRNVKGLQNLGVKQAPFYVLLGAQMPCILVEAAFISNPVVERRLRSDSYLNLLAEGIFQGVKSYRERVNLAHR